MTELAEAIYAVVEHDGTLFGCYSTQQFADDAVREFAYDGMRVVKYVPQPTLADAEREAIDAASHAAAQLYPLTGAALAATLRGLLERTK